MNQGKRTSAQWPLVVMVFSVLGFLALAVFGFLYVYEDRLQVRLDEWQAERFRAENNVAEVLPTAIGAPQVAAVTAAPTVDESAELGVLQIAPTEAANAAPTPTPAVSATPAASPTPLPASFLLTGFRYEKQKFNNCGPASLAINLSYWGWQGTQEDTAAFLKPNSDDKNVSPIELYNFLASIGYDAYIRVNGDVETLKRFIAAGYPVLVEKGLQCAPEEGSRCSDWFGHYSTVVGYDDATQTFIMQDTFRGQDYKLSYAEVMRNWQAFNYLYLVIFPAGPQRDAEVQRLLGSAADLQQNYTEALARARAETETLTERERAFAWFNVGTNLQYLRDYAGAVAAYDEARQIGLPFRMVWYQFGPYRAYYNVLRFQDVIDLSTAAINSTPKPGLEEAYYWRGLALEAYGQGTEAVADYQIALEKNPRDLEAREALRRLGYVP
ncbi:MAG: C39 family peptidase [Anaerolineales bacterium]